MSGGAPPMNPSQVAQLIQAMAKADPGVNTALANARADAIQAKADQDTAAIQVKAGNDIRRVKGGAGIQTAAQKYKEKLITQRQKVLKERAAAQEKAQPKDASELLSLPQTDINPQNPTQGIGGTDLLGTMGPQGANGGQAVQLGSRGQTVNTQGYGGGSPGMPAPPAQGNPTFEMGGQTYGAPDTITSQERMSTVRPTEIAPGNFMGMETTRNLTRTEPNVLTPGQVLQLQMNREELGQRMRIEEMRYSLEQKQTMANVAFEAMRSIDAPAGTSMRIAQSFLSGDVDTAARLAGGYDTLAHSTARMHNAAAYASSMAAARNEAITKLISGGGQPAVQTLDQTVGGIMSGSVAAASGGGGAGVSVTSSGGVRLGGGRGGNKNPFIDVSEGAKQMGYAMSARDLADADRSVQFDAGARRVLSATNMAPTLPKEGGWFSGDQGPGNIPAGTLAMHLFIATTPANQLPPKLLQAYPGRSPESLIATSRQWLDSKGYWDKKRGTQGGLIDDARFSSWISTVSNTNNQLINSGGWYHWFEEMPPETVAQTLLGREFFAPQAEAPQAPTAVGTISAAEAIRNMNRSIAEDRQAKLRDQAEQAGALSYSTPGRNMVPIR